MLIKIIYNDYTWHVAKVIIFVSILLQHGADPNIANKDNATPLFLTCLKGHDVCVSTQLHHGADPNIANKNSATPLYAACYKHNNKCACVLL